MAASAISHVSTEYGEIILNEATGDYWHLNETAATIFKELRAGRPREEVIENIVATYNAVPNQVRSDVENLENHLKGVGVV